MVEPEGVPLKDAIYVGQLTSGRKLASLQAGRPHKREPEEIIQLELKRPVKAIWGRERPVELHHIILLLRTSQVALVIKNSPAIGGDIRDLGSWVGKIPWT